MMISAKRYLSSLWRILTHNDFDLIAASVAFYALFSVFPALAALIAIFGLVADPHVVQSQLGLWSEVIPAQAFALFDAQINALLAAGQATLGWATALSIVIALWSARAGVGALVRGINAIFGAPVRQGHRHLIAAMILTLGLIGMALVALMLVVVAPVVIAFLPADLAPGWAGEVARWAAALAVLVFGLGVLYRYSPNQQGARHGLFTPGLGFAVVAWFAASIGFSQYLSNFGRYNELYGALGAVIALLMWFYISAYIVLLGAALNVALAQEK